jgi:hypothetical protein
MVKHQMMHQEFHSQQEILPAITKSWDDLTFAEVESVFSEWSERLTRVAGNNGEYYPN